MFFKGTVTICWREIIPVVKLAHSEPGGVVRVDAIVCVKVCASVQGLLLQLGASMHHFVHLLFLYIHLNVFAFLHVSLCRETHITHMFFHCFCQKIYITF